MNAATIARSDFGLLALRVVTGIIFAAHGWQKFFQTGLDGVTGFFASLGIPMAGIAAPAVATLELAGGVLLIIGLLTRPLGVLFALNMAGAIFFAKTRGEYGFGDVELELLLLAASLCLAMAGPGAWAVDKNIAARRRLP
ncbi:MAG TPA: DoxX family protein [Gemmatimonadales bacterium]|nr:DoxX family protein [Gemmatimonadales bacterium]